jgi:hypothetical protein
MARFCRIDVNVAIIDGSIRQPIKQKSMAETTNHEMTQLRTCLVT